MAVALSVIIPVHNEAESLVSLHDELMTVLRRLGREHEVLYVDDGSSDGSFEVLAALRRREPRVIVLRLARNFGQTAAIQAGFEHAAGEVLVTLDGDGQNDPADIPALLDKLAAGFDLVTGWRRPRHDTFLSRRLPSLVANAIIGWTTGVHLHDYGCGLKAFRRHRLLGLRLFGEMHRFLPALAADLGARVAEIPVRHRPRRHGVSKYGLARTGRVLVDLLALKFLWGHAASPMGLFGSTGLLCTAGGLAITGYLGFQRLVLHLPIAGRPLLWLGILLTLAGMQLVAMGLLGELLVRTYRDAVAQPLYRVAETLRSEGAPDAASRDARPEMCPRGVS
jgi:glycosyltransferase involved in cell wall biosynthesis